MSVTKKIIFLGLCALALTLLGGCKVQNGQVESSSAEAVIDLTQPISGEMHYYLNSAPAEFTALMRGLVCFTPSPSKSFSSSRIFCFSNQDEAKNMFGLTDLKSTSDCPNYFTRATIRVKDYIEAKPFSQANTCVSNGTCPFSRTQLVDLISQAESPPLCAPVIESLLEPSGIAW